MKRTNYSIALEIDRTLSLNLSNYEFEILAEYLSQSDNPELIANDLIHAGVKLFWKVLEQTKKK